MVDDLRHKKQARKAAKHPPQVEHDFLKKTPPVSGGIRHLYDYHDAAAWSLTPVLPLVSLAPTRSLDDLMARDKQRESDGFPRKIRLGKVVKPGGKDDDRVVVVPTTVEEKFMHDVVTVEDEGEGGAGGEDPVYGGQGAGEEGEVVGEQPIRNGQEGGTGAGHGEGSTHEIDSNAYELGRILTEEFKLPNLKDKGKKRSLTKYSYDLTDRHKGFGQIIDKKATLRQIIQTNIGLGRVKARAKVRAGSLLVSPSDRVYRILSK